MPMKGRRGQKHEKRAAIALKKRYRPNAAAPIAERVKTTVRGGLSAASAAEPITRRKAVARSSANGGPKPGKAVARQFGSIIGLAGNWQVRWRWYPLSSRAASVWMSEIECRNGDGAGALFGRCGGVPH